MTALLASEIRRLASRRIVFWMALAMLGYVVMIVVITTSVSKPASAFSGDAMRTVDLWLQRENAQRLGISARNMIVTVAVINYLLIIVIGASAIGAEYRAGTVTTVLTWEPRRVRLLAARFLAAAIVSMLFFVGILVLFIGAFVLGASINGVSEGADSRFWQDLAAAVARGTLLAGALAVISAALATLGRNTAAAMGIWFGYLVAIEGILQARIHEVRPWTLILNASAFFSGETVRFGDWTVGAGAGTFRVALYLVVIAAVAFVVFRRRDVT